MKLEDFKPLIPSILAIGLAVLKSKSGGRSLFEGRGGIEIFWKKPDALDEEEWIYAQEAFEYIINDLNANFEYFDSTYIDFASDSFSRGDYSELEEIEQVANEDGADFDPNYLVDLNALDIFGNYASKGDMYFSSVVSSLIVNEVHNEANTETTVLGAVLRDLYDMPFYGEDDRLKYMKENPRFRLNYIQVWNNEDYGEDVFRAMIYFDKIGMLSSGIDGIKKAIYKTASIAADSLDEFGCYKDIPMDIRFGQIEGASQQEIELSNPNARETKVRIY